MTLPVIAVVGATGVVGLEMLDVLEKRSFPLAGLRLLASPRSAGKKVRFRDEEIAVEPLANDSFRGVDIAMFAAGSDVSKEHASKAVEAGAVVVDNSSAFRMSSGVPLVVPEWNASALDGHAGIIANPNCSTIILIMALAPLAQVAGLRRVVVSTYQAASGAGREAMEEMRESTRCFLDGRSHEPQALPGSLAFNLFPHVDVFCEDAYTREEDKMLHETRKILGSPELLVEATCVRVAVERCHSEAVTVELDRSLSPDEARAIFARAPGLIVRDEPGDYPVPAAMSGQDDVAVGRVRESRVFDGGLAFWLVGDQLRKGAALNAVQIAELLLAKIDSI